MNLTKFQKFELFVHGQKISYLQSGRDPTILFLHGLGIGPASIWDKVLKHLDNQNTIVLLDLPGYGLNADLRISPKFNEITKFISDFIEKKSSISYLVSYSLSGTFSFRIAQHPPANLKKIIFVSSPFFYSRFVIFLNWLFKAVGSHPLITKVVKFAIGRFPVKHLIFFLGGLASITEPKAMNECMDKFGEEVNSSYIFNFASTMFSPTQFAPISLPVEFIYGENDGIATTKMAKKAQSHCRNSRLQIVKDVYHLMPLEKPNELARLIQTST